MKPLTLAVLLAVGPLSRGGALEVVQHVWGFDGRVVPQRIAILSVLVANRTDQPFDGAMVLTKSMPVGGRLGARLVEPCFLSPGATRWVQLYPFVQRANETWVLTWGRGADGRLELRSPKLAPPGRVLLVKPDDPLLREATFPVLPDNLWPPTVAATDGCHSIVLDHAPRWEPVRREAFLDWLRRGGILHLVHDRDGRYPAFPADLAMLNAPLDRIRVGAGLAVRHPCPRNDLDGKALARQGYALPEFQDNTAGGVNFGNLQGTVDNLTEDFLQTLSTASRPRHSWALIYLTALAYIGTVCIYHFFYARKTKDWRRTMVMFAGLVAACSVLLGFIGKRGQGEAAAVSTIAYARHLGGDQYDVTQWSNVFVTQGSVYPITHDGTHNLYSTCQEEEAVEGMIHNGRQGSLAVNMPLFSSRSFLHRAKLQGHPIKLAVKSYQADGSLSSLVLVPEEGFPVNAAEMYALYRGSFYRLAFQGGELRLLGGRLAADRLLAPRELHVHAAWGGSGRGLFVMDEPQKSSRKEFATFVPALIARAIGGNKGFRVQTLHPKVGQAPVQLFVFTELPETFHAQGEKLGKRKGYVLYHIPLFPPEAPDG